MCSNRGSLDSVSLGQGETKTKRGGGGGGGRKEEEEEKGGDDK